MEFKTLRKQAENIHSSCLSISIKVMKHQQQNEKIHELFRPFFVRLTTYHDHKNKIMTLIVRRHKPIHENVQLFHFN